MNENMLPLTITQITDTNTFTMKLNIYHTFTPNTENKSKKFRLVICKHCHAYLTKQDSSGSTYTQQAHCLIPRLHSISTILILCKSKPSLAAQAKTNQNRIRTRILILGSGIVCANLNIIRILIIYG